MPVKLSKLGIKGFSNRWLVGLVLAAAFLLAFSTGPTCASDKFEDEVRIGKDEAANLEKDPNVKLVDDPALVQRIETIGKAIADVAINKEVPATYGKATLAEFTYTFKIIDDKDVNAFSLPGGFIYINKGLIDYAQSDDELAGVIAHEVAHVAHHHGMLLVKARQKAMLELAAAVLGGAVLGAKGSDLGNLAYAGNLVTLAKMSGYGQKAELDADRTAVAYMAETKYNPIGVLTFLERLAADEIRKPQLNLGIFATHPPTHERARCIVEEITNRNIKINRRLVTTYMRVEAKPVPDSEAYAVWVAGAEVVRLADADGHKASARAQRIADKLAKMFLAGMGMRDVKVGGGGQYVVTMGDVLLAPTAEDAKLAGKSVAGVTESVVSALKKMLFKERLDQGY